MERVLIVPAGTANGWEIYQALKGYYSLFAADSEPYNATSLVAGRGLQVPKGFGPDFFSALYSICQTEKIDLIFPTHDDLLIPFSQRTFPGDSKAVVSSPRANRITARKDTTYQHLMVAGLHNLIPKIYGSIGEEEYPCFIRPCKGRGSQFALKLNSVEESHLMREYLRHSIVTEYLPGKEYTIDCVSSLEGQLLGTCIRERIYIQNGITKIGRVVSVPELEEMAEKISKVLLTRGPWFFQVKYGYKGPKLLEINLRVSGTSNLSRRAGFENVLASARIFLDRDPQLRKPEPIVISRFTSELVIKE